MTLRLLIILMITSLAGTTLAATFGQTSAGGSYAVLDDVTGNNKIATKFTMGATGGTVDSITAFMRTNWDGDDDVTLFIYSDDSNSPDVVVDSAVGTTSATGGSWISAEAAIGATLTGSTDYWLGVRNKSATLTGIAYTDATGYSRILTADAGTLDDPWSGGSVNDNSTRVSIYVTYTVTGVADISYVRRIKEGEGK